MSEKLQKNFKVVRTLSLSKNSVFVILRLDRGIQKVFKTLDTRLRGYDNFYAETDFFNSL